MVMMRMLKKMVLMTLCVEKRRSLSWDYQQNDGDEDEDIGQRHHLSNRKELRLSLGGSKKPRSTSLPWAKLKRLLTKGIRGPDVSRLWQNSNSPDRGPLSFGYMRYMIGFAFNLENHQPTNRPWFQVWNWRLCQGLISQDIVFLIFLSRSGMEHFVRSSYPGSSRKTLRNLKKRQRAGTISELTGDKNIPTYVLPLRGIIHFKIQHSWQKVRTLTFWFPEETPLFFQ